MKTIRQIAEEIGVDKQRVYRHIKKERVIEAYQKSGVMYYDDTAELRIKQRFSENPTSSDTVIDTVISILKNELEVKNQIIIEQQQTIKGLTDTIKIQAENVKPQKKKVYTNNKGIAAKGKSAPIERLINNSKGSI